MSQKIISKYNKYKYFIFTFLSLATFFSVTKKEKVYITGQETSNEYDTVNMLEKANADIYIPPFVTSGGDGDGGDGVSNITNN
jgi:hypothetical protein